MFGLDPTIFVFMQNYSQKKSHRAEIQMMKKFFLCAIVLFFSLCVFAAENSGQNDPNKKWPEKLPFGYGDIKLGMTVDEVKEALLKNREFGYRGDRDVSFSPMDNQVLIETDATLAGFSYFDRCWFQFADGKLYIITINLNKEKIDHYSVFTALCSKYGGPNQINPRKSQWQDDDVMMSLERPLALKYIDAKVFADRQNQAKVQKTYGEQNRDNFLGGL